MSDVASKIVNPMEQMIQQAVSDAVRVVVREEIVKAFEEYGFTKSEF